MSVTRTCAVVLESALLSSLAIGPVFAQQGPPPGVPGAAVVDAVRHDTSPPLRSITPIAEDRTGGREAREPRPIRGRRSPAAPRLDGALQESVPAINQIVPTTNFDGVNNRNGVLPPDVNGDVGPNHYVQWVNLSFAIYSKSGQLLYGPANGTTLFAGFDPVCRDNNDGDPIVLYDERADRWLMSQFALPNTAALLRGPFYQCIAISQTGDPTGAWHRYLFKISDTKLNDYPKFGVWPDGYYMAVNQFNEVSGSWGGQGVVAFEREKMLLGQTAQALYFDLYTRDPNLGGLLPSDLDGDLDPPAGAPNYFIAVDDDAWGYSPDQLQVWAFDVDWSTPSASTFSKVGTMNVASFDWSMCDGQRACIPQPGTSARLDALSDRLMYRLQYRNFGGHESWVVNHTVDVNGSDRAGVRWYELRKLSSGSIAIHQQGTFSPDATHRWMASAAMDQAGNIGLAYNYGDATLYPSIRFTGRLAGDPLGQMTQGENDIMFGTGAQTHTASRWGDYSMLAVDPVDDCTFWATLEYVQTTGEAAWRTRIAAFRLPNCGSAPPTPPLAPSNLAASAFSASQINLSWSDNSANETGFKIERCQGQGCSDFGAIATVGAGVTSYSNTSLTASTFYSYRVLAYNAGGNSAYSNTASATTPAAPPPPGTTPAAPSGLTAKSNRNSVQLRWKDNANNETRYEVERNVNGAGFSTLAGALAANTTNYSDTSNPRGSLQYRVRACNANGCSAYSNIASVSR